jgi:hypothetical protein
MHDRGGSAWPDCRGWRHTRRPWPSRRQRARAARAGQAERALAEPRQVEMGAPAVVAVDPSLRGFAGQPAKFVGGRHGMRLARVLGSLRALPRSRSPASAEAPTPTCRVDLPPPPAAGRARHPPRRLPRRRPRRPTGARAARPVGHARTAAPRAARALPDQPPHHRRLWRLLPRRHQRSRPRAERAGPAGPRPSPGAAIEWRRADPGQATRTK